MNSNLPSLLFSTSAALFLVLSLQISRLYSTHFRLLDNQNDSSVLHGLANSGTFSGLGYSNLLADAFWLDLIQYFGNYDARKQSGYGSSKQMLQAVVQSDPLFLDAYLFSTFALAWKQGQSDVAVSILKQGTNAIDPSVNPYAYRLWYQIALVEALWNGNAVAAHIAFNNTADWIEAVTLQQREVTDISLRPSHLRSLGQRFRDSPRGVQVRFDIWVQVLQQATADEIKQLALAELETLGGVRRLPEGGFQLLRPDADETSP